jgi:hypothetical protein
MGADEKLARIHVKVERAKKHIADVNARIVTFINTNPYAVSCKVEAETRRPVYYISKVSEIPVDLAMIAGDAIQNLRTSLDHLARQLHLMVPGANPDAEFNFPVHNTAKDHEAFLKRVVKRLRQDAVDALRAAQAYKGGNGHQLWVLNRLNNIDKHRVLVTVGSAYQSVDLSKFIPEMKNPVTGEVFKPPSIFIRPADRKCPLKEGDKLFIDAPDAQCKQDVHFRFDVALNEPGIVESEPLIETLQHLADLVGGTLTAFKPCLA